MESLSRYVVGIDLGTTNTAVAYIDTQDVLDDEYPPIRVFDILQLITEGETAPLPTLPSFLYFINEQERATGRIRLPWEPGPTYTVGAWARDQGALTPGQWVASAKSWLCHGDVDRTAKILPWGTESGPHACSPVEASARYLMHIRDAWNHHFGANTSRGKPCRFEHQDIVLTVPASFDAEARELTVQAARDAGIEHLTLLEEPQAAFYAWSSTHRNRLTQDLSDGDLVLICDIGGGTTDLSLIRVRIVDDAVQHVRTAIGAHVLLGGDNVDFALAHRLEAKLNHPQLTMRQRQSLRRQSCAAKERLLSDPDLDRIAFSILGSGRALVGGTLHTELTRNEVVDTLVDGFLPLTDRDDRPTQERRAGLRELGLPYANEPAITKHLAQFLAENAEPDDAGHASPIARPDAILFNGGFFIPGLTRERIVEAISSWFQTTNRGWQPHVLNRAMENPSPETAVAIGAAYYGNIRRTGGLRIGGGSARAYYIGLQTDVGAADHDVPAICVMPRGTEEGSTLDLPDRVFKVLTNRPVAFILYSSTSRHDAHGSLVALDLDDVRQRGRTLSAARGDRRHEARPVGDALMLSMA
jgi:molecular chaperone DnaK (HSP70)